MTAWTNPLSHARAPATRGVFAVRREQALLQDASEALAARGANRWGRGGFQSMSTVTRRLDEGPRDGRSGFVGKGNSGGRGKGKGKGDGGRHGGGRIGTRPPGEP